ncbi:MAG: hypothetical protein ABUS48_07265 [Pseudomonadota bacterium]
MRLAVISALCGAAVWLGGCSSQGQTVEEAARQACEAQHFATTQELAECIDQTVVNIQAARDLGNKPPERPQRGGGGGQQGH